jgi:hypothetical protein
MKELLILIVTVTLFTACGGYNSSVLEKESAGYIKFIGNKTNASVEIDQSIQFNINPETDLYKLTPGKHIVKIYRDNNLIVERIIIIQSQNTIEVEVP